MKRSKLILLHSILITGLLVSSVQASVSVVKTPYQPKKIYGGPNQVNGIFFRNPGSPNWQRGFRLELKNLTCKSALSGFFSTGSWQGHLNPNGSCADPAEPSEWATGNRLNYEGIVSDTAN